MTKKNSIEYAIEKAKELPWCKGEQRFYCMILDKRGKVLSTGYNSYTKTSPKMLMYAMELGNTDKVFWHSECNALSKLPKESKPYKIIIARITPGGNVGLAQPCPICMNAIKKSGIQIIEHTT